MTPGDSLWLVIVLCAILSVITYWLGLLTKSGSLASFVVGSIIGIFGSIYWLALLILFALTGFVVTKIKLEQKRRQGVQEGNKGERSWVNVVANGSIPVVVAIIAFVSGNQDSELARLAYLCAISVAASDTVASELGVLSPKVRLITTWEHVKPGTDGGISAYGSVWAFLGSVFAAVVGWLILFDLNLDVLVLVPLFIGFIGCNIDSLIGATWERRGVVGKLGNNMLSMAAGTVLGYVIVLLL